MIDESDLAFTADNLIHRPALVPITFTMIVKNNAAGLRDAIPSIKAVMAPDDQLLVLDTGSTDDTPKVAESLGAEVYSTRFCRNVHNRVRAWLPEHYKTFKASDYASGMIMDFSAARNHVTAQAAHDWIFWIDSDDVIQDPDGVLRELMNRLILSGKRDSMMLEYHYAYDKYGNVSTVLKRERLFDRRKYHWVGRCHETAIPRPGAHILGAALFPDLKARIAHVNKPRDTDHRLSDIRNYIILRAEVEEARKKGRRVDPRTIYYLGNAAKGLKRDEEAIGNYRALIKNSGSRDDRFAAAYSIGATYLESKRVPEAMDWFFKCQQLNTADPRAFYMLARCYYLLGRFQESVFYFHVGRMLPEPKLSLHTYDPTHIHIKPLHIAILAYKELNDAQAVTDLMDELKSKAPNDDETRRLEETLTNWFSGARLADSAKVLLANIKNPNTQRKYDTIRRFLGELNAVPPELEASGLGALEPPDDRGAGAGDVVFFCGHTVEPWGPSSARTGIGGSERMVIEMAPRLAAKGFRVSVYCNVPFVERGLHDDGVNWQHFSAFNYNRRRGTVIFWRSVKAVEIPICCDKRIVWCHDVQTPAEWTPERIATLDQAWFLSDYHASTVGDEARALLEKEEKLVITRNGVDDSLAGIFEEAAKRRDPKKVVFFSSPDRGVLTAVNTFIEAKHLFPKELDGAKLHIFYGFTKAFMDRAAKYEYFHVPDIDRDVNAYEYMKAVYAAIDAHPDVIFHGRVGFEEAARHMGEAGVWFYPTRFPEISCMGAMEAQCAGCNIVSTDYAALLETIRWDGRAHRLADLNDVAECAHVLARAITNPAPAPTDEPWERFSLNLLATEWANLLQN